eukprot:c27219_g1_i1 orf=66-1415(+)
MSSKIFGRVSGKTLLWFAVFIILTVSLFLSTIDLRSSLSTRFMHIRDKLEHNGLSKDPALDPQGKCNSPLRVYMYDIPRKFNLGMLKPSDPKQDLPWMDKRIPPWPRRSGLKKQHSVEYWMMAYLLGDQEDEVEDRAAVRVKDPSQADVFFMPFFSSLSFNIHGINMKDPETEKDRILQAEVVKFLKESPWWEHSGGRNHVLVVHHPNAFRFLRNEVNASIFVVADFGRLPQNVSRLSKDVVAPYTHVVNTYVDDDVIDPFESRTTLLFFRGKIRRKDGGIVRIKLAKLLQNYSRVQFEESAATVEGLELATEGMRKSLFCLHPAGDTPSSCRLFDAIVSHCVPVIVSDYIELPFEEEIDYKEFCLFFSKKEALRPGYLMDYLEQFPKERWLKMWNRLKQVAHHFEYQHPGKKDDAVDMLWKQIRQKVPAVRLAVHRSKRLKVPDLWHW